MMHLDDALGIINQLHQQGVKKIHFSGGEVFLHPDIFIILKHASSLGIQVNLTSNGILIDKNVVKKIVESKVHSISISLDAPFASMHDKIRGVKGAFKKTAKALSLLTSNLKKAPKVRVNTVITSKNAVHLCELHDFLLSISKKIHWKLIPVDSDKKSIRPSKEMILKIIKDSEKWILLSEPPYLSKNIEKISKGKYSVDYYKKQLCFMPWLNLFVTPEAHIYPCYMTRGKIASIGNLKDNSLYSLLNSERMKSIKMNFASLNLFEVCSFCDDFFFENGTIGELIEELECKK